LKSIIINKVLRKTQSGLETATTCQQTVVEFSVK